MFTIHPFTYETMLGKRSLRVAIVVIILFAVVFILFIFILVGSSRTKTSARTDRSEGSKPKLSECMPNGTR